MKRYESRHCENKNVSFLKIGLVLLSMIIIFGCMPIGPMAMAKNNNPLNNSPALTSGSVTPSIGTTTTTFTYKVTYSDRDGDSPITYCVIIDGKWYSMTYVSGNMTLGALYQYKTTLSAGNHNYYFYLINIGYSSF